MCFPVKPVEDCVFPVKSDMLKFCTESFDTNIRAHVDLDIVLAVVHSYAHWLGGLGFEVVVSSFGEQFVGIPWAYAHWLSGHDLSMRLPSGRRVGAGVLCCAQYRESESRVRSSDAAGYEDGHSLL